MALVKPIVGEEVKCAMRGMRKDSSPGYDGIPIALLADAWVPVRLPDGSVQRVHVLMDRIMKLFNLVLGTAQVPVDWVRSVVSYIAKPHPGMSRPNPVLTDPSACARPCTGSSFRFCREGCRISAKRDTCFVILKWPLGLAYA